MFSDLSVINTKFWLPTFITIDGELDNEGKDKTELGCG